MTDRLHTLPHMRMYAYDSVTCMNAHAHTTDKSCAGSESETKQAVCRLHKHLNTCSCNSKIIVVAVTDPWLALPVTVTVSDGYECNLIYILRP